MKQKYLNRNKLISIISMVMIIIVASVVVFFDYGNFGATSTISTDEVEDIRIIEVMPRKIEGKNPSWFIIDGDPGDSFDGEIYMINKNKTKNKTVQLYPVDVNVNAGGFAPESQDAKLVGAGMWIQIKNPIHTLKPGESKIVQFKGRIPKSATPGQHAAAIMAEEVVMVKESAPSVILSGSSQYVSIKTRVGLRTYITVRGEMKIGAEVGEPVIVKKNPFLFKIKIKNTGNTILRPSISGVVTNSKNETVFTIDKRELYEIPPTGTIQAEVPWETELWGRYKVSFMVGYGSQPGQSVERFVNVTILPHKKYMIAAAVALGFFIFNILLFVFFRRKKDDVQPMYYQQYPGMPMQQNMPEYPPQQFMQQQMPPPPMPPQQPPPMPPIG